MHKLFCFLSGLHTSGLVGFRSVSSGHGFSKQSALGDSIVTFAEVLRKRGTPPPIWESGIWMGTPSGGARPRNSVFR